MSETSDHFCDWYKAFNSITDGVDSHRREQLRAFERWAMVPAEQMTPQMFADWLTYMIEEGIKPSSISTYARLIKPFHHWLYKEGIITADMLMEFREVKLPRVPPSQPKPYSHSELKVFWRQFDKQYYPVRPIFWGRWRRGTSKWKKVWVEAMRVQLEAIISLALDCGLRKSEIHSIAIEDMHPDLESVIVRSGKGDKYREVPHTEASRLACHRWLELRTELQARLPGPKHDFPWMILDPRAMTFTTPKSPMGMAAFENKLKKIGSGYEFHRMRHTCGTEWLRAGVPIEKVQKLLGHSNMDMTLRYAQIANSDVQVAMGRAESKFSRAVRPGRQAA